MSSEVVLAIQAMRAAWEKAEHVTYPLAESKESVEGLINDIRIASGGVQMAGGAMNKAVALVAGIENCMATAMELSHLLTELIHSAESSIRGN